MVRLAEGIYGRGRGAVVSGADGGHHHVSDTCSVNITDWIHDTCLHLVAKMG